MTKPKISVITITYNAEAYIERTLQSVIAQTYPNIEYIVVDGASKDGTVSILNKYRDQIDSFTSEPDKNLYDGMNNGIGKATGEYLAFMNAGDSFYKSTSLEEIMDGSEDADFIYAKALCIDESGNQSPWHKKTPPPNELSDESFIEGMLVCHQCMVVKRSICPDFLISPWKISCDIDWSIKVMQKAKSLHFMDEYFCLYLKDGLSAREWPTAVWERFQISAQYFGWYKTIKSHIWVGSKYLLKRLKG